jgi:hypothetical protein
MISVDNTRSEGPVSRFAIEGALTYAWAGGTEVADTQLLSPQFVFGPKTADGRLADIVRWVDDYSLRIRLNLVIPGDEEHAIGGPMTVALQRYLVSEPLSIGRLLSLHVGLEAALATPWFAGRMRPPPTILTSLNAVDTEMARNGWSIRPLAGYVRFDFLACRNLSTEAGASPELFVPTQPDSPREYNLRFHWRGGLSFACSNRADSWSHHLAVALEYRGRARLYSDDAPVAYYHLLSPALQYDFPQATVTAFVDLVPYGFELRHGYRTIGVRAQFGFY